MRFNINEAVRVKLTDEGRAHHRQKFEEFKAAFPNFPLPYRAPKEDADGWSEWQLWDLMATFGAGLYLGGPTLFETTIDIPVDEPSASFTAPKG